MGRLSLVLGGGGMRGLAHVGVLRALRRRGLVPDEYIGVSVGSYVAALAAGGLEPDEVRDLALSVQRRDLLDYDWLGLLWNRGRARSLYRGKALHDFIRRTLPYDRFDELPHPLYITAVDLCSAREVVWGMPGYRDIPLHDCVVASCSLPGIYPPKKIGPFYFVDGGIVDTLPVKVAVYSRAELIIAVHLDSGEPSRPPRGMAGILEQSQVIVSRALVEHNLRAFQSARLVVLRPRTPLGLFDFFHPEKAIEAGEQAVEEAFALHPLLRAEKKAPAPPEGGAGAPGVVKPVTGDSAAG